VQHKDELGQAHSIKLEIYRTCGKWTKPLRNKTVQCQRRPCLNQQCLLTVTTPSKYSKGFVGDPGLHLRQPCATYGAMSVTGLC
jgi:hypothetical protein